VRRGTVADIAARVCDDAGFGGWRWGEVEQEGVRADRSDPHPAILTDGRPPARRLLVGRRDALHYPKVTYAVVT
jgi:hypothetical protein